VNVLNLIVPAVALVVAAVTLVVTATTLFVAVVTQILANLITLHSRLEFSLLWSLSLNFLPTLKLMLLLCNLVLLSVFETASVLILYLQNRQNQEA
jgi:hypothetical protein